MRGLKRNDLDAGQGINARHQQSAVGVEKDISNRRHPLWPF